MNFKSMNYTTERLTDNYKPEVFGYTLKDHGSENLVGLFRDYDVFFAHQKAICRLGYLEDMLTLRNIDDWNEGDGCCLWWSRYDIESPPMYVGTPLDSNWDDEMTWFIQIPNPIRRKQEENAELLEVAE